MIHEGAMVLGHSLRDHVTKKQLVVLVTVDALHTGTLDALKVQLNMRDMENIADW